jgi:hypothetical protein
MGKATGFMEFPRTDRVYAPVADRLQHYQEFVIALSEELDGIGTAFRANDDALIGIIGGWAFKEDDLGYSSREGCSTTTGCAAAFFVEAGMVEEQAGNAMRCHGF